VTTRDAAEKAVLVYKETQPAIDALKSTTARNTAAKKTLGAYMTEKNIATFRGVTLTCVPYDGWDYDKLRAYLGDKVKTFQRSLDRKHFAIVKRRAPK